MTNFGQWNVSKTNVSVTAETFMLCPFAKMTNNISDKDCVSSYNWNN